jgi:hypothetical protein
VGKVRLSDITIDKVGGLENGAIVVCTKDSKNLTKGKHYVLSKTMTLSRPIYYVRNDKGVACSEMKFFVYLKDWRERQLKDLGI